MRRDRRLAALAASVLTLTTSSVFGTITANAQSDTQSVESVIEETKME